ncbi:MAG: phosphohistidine phosphatase SixA [Isosphaeraceae bacterium]|nr:phosphohistidine phosphatase SixA [Isosphaeraceae bacterium]
MQLYVMRHGIAVPHGTPGVAEDQRPLTPDGEKRVKEIGRGLKALGVAIDRIVSSPLPRALRTAEIVADELKAKGLLETSDVLRAGYNADAVREWLIERSEERLMIVGHNPAFSDLVALLVTGQSKLAICELRKGGVAALEGSPGARMTLDWLARPKLLRTLED